jgi:hypothetical protein
MSFFDKFNQEITECKCCSKIDNSNYVLYKDRELEDWKSSFYCTDCIKYMLLTQWEEYVKLINSANCESALKRLIEEGPPINIRDMMGLPCENETKEPLYLYYDEGHRYAQLKGSLIGEARQKWWDELKKNILFIKTVNARW